MSNQMANVVVTGVTAYPTNANFVADFDPARISVVNESDDSTAPVFISFDGKNDHGRLKVGSTTEALEFKQRTPKMWIRTDAGVYAGVVQARVIVSG